MMTAKKARLLLAMTALVSACGGGELTSGKPDLKEGIYFGAELSQDHPVVRQGTPLHGPNLFPPHMPDFRESVLQYMEAMTAVSVALLTLYDMLKAVDKAMVIGGICVIQKRGGRSGTRSAPAP